MIKQTSLENGLRLVSNSMPATNAVTVLILVKAGSRYERQEINGIAHFLEHMFFKGALKFPTAKAVSEAIDSVGGDFNAFTGKEYAGYFVKLAADKIELAMEVLGDMLSNSKFDQVEIEKEKGVILEELNMYQDNPAAQIGWDFERLMFGNQPLGWDQIGTKEFLNSVKREQLVDFFEQLYTPKNMVIAVAGKVEHQQVEDLVGKYFEFKNPERNIEKPPFMGWSDSFPVLVKDKKTEQTHLILGVPSFPDQTIQQRACRLLSVVLGGNMSSKLFQAVREEKGLAYYISSSADHFTDTGVFSISAGVTVEKVEEAVRAIMLEVDKVRGAGLTEQELRKAKDFMTGKLALRFEDCEEYAFLLAKNLLMNDKIKTPQRLTEEFEEISLSDINSILPDLFAPEKWKMALVGTETSPEKFRQILLKH